MTSSFLGSSLTTSGYFYSLGAGVVFLTLSTCSTLVSYFASSWAPLASLCTFTGDFKSSLETEAFAFLAGGSMTAAAYLALGATFYGEGAALFFPTIFS
jgi:hypothetical protein